MRFGLWDRASKQLPPFRRVPLCNLEKHCCNEMEIHVHVYRDTRKVQLTSLECVLACALLKTVNYNIKSQLMIGTSSIMYTHLLYRYLQSIPENSIQAEQHLLPLGISSTMSTLDQSFPQETKQWNHSYCVLEKKKKKSQPSDLVQNLQSYVYLYLNHT